MGNSTLLVSIIYFIVSFAIFLPCYILGRHVSGVNFRLKWFWACLVLNIFIGSIHYGVVELGYVLYLPSTKDTLEGEDLARFIALISAIAQTFCFPKKEIKSKKISFSLRAQAMDATELERI